MTILSWPLLASLPLVVFLVINLKAIPLVWHFRLFTFLLQSRSWLRPSQVQDGTLVGKTPVLFQPLILHSRSPLLEIDYYLHKSNATFFSDVDIARSHLVAALMWPLLRRPEAGVLLPSKGADVKSGNQRLAIMLGAVSCSFRREIKPFEKYEVWTRVLAWDDKWVYFVSHFVRAGVVRGRGRFTLQQQRSAVGGQRQRVAKAEVEKAVLATAVSKNVLKLGRTTVRPDDVWKAAGLWPSGGNKDALDRVEKARLRGLQALAESKDGAALHGLFGDLVDHEDGVAALGEYHDIFAWA
ncbi:hypothetical protein EDD37DRAFT_349299 [Exophiala viscosa]|uniref:uncharacterized protein n=1 Tax=Exophiala viscosa TaxID=2486360 RepID=UPI00218F026B|nr:hypothetical protein EDD37DRAFT_349299 [Exophiala viscosa]